MSVTRIAGPDKRHLDAAEGWLELGNHLEAKEELELLPPQLRTYPEVLVLRHKIYSAEKKWDLAAEAATALCERMPDYAFGFIRLAHSLHELKRTREAREVLMAVVDRFADEFIIAYNLACYECQLGNLTGARDWLKKAIDMGDREKIMPIALEDADLEPLWREISEMENPPGDK